MVMRYVATARSQTQLLQRHHEPTAHASAGADPATSGAGARAIELGRGLRALQPDVVRRRLVNPLASPYPPRAEQDDIGILIGAALADDLRALCLHRSQTRLLRQRGPGNRHGESDG
jgi:hypothetical protein